MSMSILLNRENCERVIYSSEQDFERLVAGNADALFGDAVYIDAKRRIGTASLGGTIPDGFLIDLSEPDDPQFYLVEVELKSHDFFSHIFPQITKFFAFYTNAQQRHKLTEAIFEFSQRDGDAAKRIRDASGSAEVYKFLKDTIDNNQNILIIIDGPKIEFEEVARTYTDTWGKMVKVVIVNHFTRGEDNVLTIEPPFGTLSFADAISALPEESRSQQTSYTEQFHLETCSARINDIY